jgi:hypothetical protein
VRAQVGCAALFRSYPRKLNRDCLIAEPDSNAVRARIFGRYVRDTGVEVASSGFRQSAVVVITGPSRLGHDKSEAVCMRPGGRSMHRRKSESLPVINDLISRDPVSERTERVKVVILKNPLGAVCFDKNARLRFGNGLDGMQTSIDAGNTTCADHTAWVCRTQASMRCRQGIAVPLT